jgi:hypothetical protein
MVTCPATERNRRCDSRRSQARETPEGASELPHRILGAVCKAGFIPCSSPSPERFREKSITRGKALEFADMADPPVPGPALDESASGKNPDRDRSTLSTRPLPSGEFPIGTHFDILRRFMSVSRNGAEPVEPATVEGHGIPSRSVELNTAFLCHVGLLVEERTGRFKPTPVAMQFINTQIADEGRGRRLLRSLIEKTWFGKAARSLLGTDPALSSRDKDVMVALAASAQLPAGEGEGALHVLMDYLAYAGIIDRTDRGLLPPSGKSNRTVPASSDRHLRVPARPSTKRLESEDAPPVTDHPHEIADWEVIQTSEFYLRIQPNPAAVKRFRKQLDLLDQKLKEGPKPE